MHIIENGSFLKIIEHLCNRDTLSVDTETYGVEWGDDLFSVIFADEEEEYYFNFNSNSPEEYFLGSVDIAKDMQPIFDSCKLLCGHNIKFDLHRLSKHELLFPCDLHDTMIAERLLNNDGLSYSLDVVAKKYGYLKDDAVEKYISANGLYSWQEYSGKDKRTKLKHYDKVPFDIMAPYACKDARITYDIAMKQIGKLNETSLRN